MHKNNMLCLYESVINIKTSILCSFIVLLSSALAGPVYAVESKSDQALISAVRQDDLAKVERLLKEGANPNVTTRFGATPLFFSAANMGKRNTESTSLKIMSLLIKAGATVNARTVNGQTALIASAGTGSVFKVGMLLSAGAKPDFKTRDGDSALVEAAVRGYTKIVIMLLQANADPNITDNNGRTPLIIAAMQAPEGSNKKSPYEIIADVLLAHGANPNAKDRNGQSALTIVAVGNKNVLVYPLIAHNANVNVTDPLAAGATPLIIAAKQGNVALVKALLRAHPDIQIKDNRGMTALDYAEQHHFEKIIDMLNSSGS